MCYSALDRPVFGVVKGFDLDLRFLAFVDESNVFILNKGFNLHLILYGHNDHDGLRSWHNAANRMNSQLLNVAIHGCRESKEIAVRNGTLCILTRRGRKLEAFVQLILRALAYFRNERITLMGGIC